MVENTKLCANVWTMIIGYSNLKKNIMVQPTCTIRSSPIRSNVFYWILYQLVREGYTYEPNDVNKLYILYERASLN